MVSLASSGRGKDSILQMMLAKGFPPMFTFSTCSEMIGLSVKHIYNSFKISNVISRSVVLSLFELVAH